jgi:hypothetical protein
MLLAFVLAQLAVASIAWGHAAKLAGLVEIARELVATQRNGSDAGAAVPGEPAPPSESAIPPADVLTSALPAAAPLASSPAPPSATELGGS